MTNLHQRLMDQSVEEWRPVVGFEGLYEVSDQGRVRSLDRVETSVAWGRRVRCGRAMKPKIGNNGYVQVMLRRPGERHTFLVHRLVAMAFMGCPATGLHCCHNNGNKRDNRLGNLRWDTSAGNNADKRKHGTWQGGERNNNSKLTAEDVKLMRKLHYEEGISQKTLAAWFEVSVTHASNVIRGVSWGHI
jgi:hypothetical protein